MGSVDRPLATLTDIAVAALSSPPGSNVIGPVLEAVRRSIGADVAGYYVCEWDGWTTAVQITPSAAWARVPNPRLPTFLAASAHPGIQHCLKNPACEPFAITDLVSQRAWQGSEHGLLMRPDWRRNYQLAIPVSSSRGRRESRVWVLGRSDRNFTHSDRQAAASVQPLLDIVSRNYQCWQEQRHDLPRVDQPLTERELTILQLLETGLTAPGAAARLGISARTVHKHTERIYRKLGAHNLNSALRVAAEMSILLGPLAN